MVSRYRGSGPLGRLQNHEADGDQSLAIDKLIRRPGPAVHVTSAIMRTVEPPRQVVDRLARASRFCSASAGCDRVSRP